MAVALTAVWAWMFFFKERSKPAAVATLPITQQKSAVLTQVPAVEAPQIAPAPAKDPPPVVLTDEQRAADAAMAQPYRDKAQQFLDILEGSRDARIAAAPDEAARAKMAQQTQDMIDFQKKVIARVTDPPSDLGDFSLQPTGPGLLDKGQDFTLPTGETFTLRIMNNADRGTEVMLSQPMQQYGKGGSQNTRVTPTPGQPIIMMLGDGALIKFTPQGTVTPPQPVMRTAQPGEPPPPPSGDGKAMTFVGRG